MLRNARSCALCTATLSCLPSICCDPVLPCPHADPPVSHAAPLCPMLPPCVPCCPACVPCCPACVPCCPRCVPCCPPCVPCTINPGYMYIIKSIPHNPAVLYWEGGPARCGLGIWRGPGPRCWVARATRRRLRVGGRAHPPASRIRDGGTAVGLSASQPGPGAVGFAAVALLWPRGHFPYRGTAGGLHTATE